jgi:hypothetical protein
MLLALLLGECAREARFGEHDQIFNLEGIHARSAIAAGSHKACAIRAEDDLVDGPGMAVEGKGFERLYHSFYHFLPGRRWPEV